jgi:hypothetical protein
MDLNHVWKPANCDSPKSCRLRVSFDQGCTQGGDLSQLLWSLVVDILLAQLNREDLYTQGYADDFTLLITGKFPSTVSELMQRALNIAICQS